MEIYKVYRESEDQETPEFLGEFKSYNEAVDFVNSQGATTLDFKSLLGHSESWCSYETDEEACYNIVW